MKLHTILLISLLAALLIFCGVSAECNYTGCGCECWKDNSCTIDKTCAECVMPAQDRTPIRFYVDTNEDGTYTMTVWFRNMTTFDWPAGLTLECKAGGELIDSSKLDDAVIRNGVFIKTYDLKEYEAGKRLVFSVLNNGRFVDSYYIRL